MRIYKIKVRSDRQDVVASAKNLINSFLEESEIPVASFVMDMGEYATNSLYYEIETDKDITNLILAATKYIQDHNAEKIGMTWVDPDMGMAGWLINGSGGIVDLLANNNPSVPLELMEDFGDDLFSMAGMAHQIPDLKSTSENDIREWFVTMYEKGMMFHLDDKPEEIVNMGGEPFFTKEQCLRLDSILSRIFNAIGKDRAMDIASGIKVSFNSEEGHDLVFGA